MGNPEPMLKLQDLLSVESVRPEVDLMVNGKLITFLCDTGACRTACKEIIPNCRYSGNYVAVRSAEGSLTLSKETDPVWIRDPHPDGTSGQLWKILLQQVSLGPAKQIS